MAFDEKKLGARLADQRRWVHLTQAQLAERVGVTVETISRLERGLVMPSLARLEQIALALGLRLADAFEDAGPVSAEERSVARLLSIVRARSADDIDLIADVAEQFLRRLDAERG